MSFFFFLHACTADMHTSSYTKLSSKAEAIDAVTHIAPPQHLAIKMFVWRCSKRRR